MTITIHRGLNQIGGCITEISTDSSRVFIDLGQNLPGNGEKTTPEQDKAMVESLFRNNPRAHEAVVYTHGHEDHIGLFNYVPKGIPQMIGEGAKEVLLEKYRIFCEKDVKEGSDPTMDRRKYNKLKTFKTWPRSRQPQPFSIGNIQITPFFNCHSIYDSYMFLIEADGKRIWHTGDFRQHGWTGGKLMQLLKWKATDIDVLITEGTMLGSSDECIHEKRVSEKMAAVMQAFKYVFVLASSTDIERLASINLAAKRSHKPLYICQGLMNAAMRVFTRREAETSEGLFDFKPHFYNENRQLFSMGKHEFVLVCGVSQYEKIEMLRGVLPEEETLLIYSSWDGYYKDPEQVKTNPMYSLFRNIFHNVVDIHTSGHADRKTIQKVIETVNPKQAIIGIHKEKGQTLASLPLSDELKGKLLELDESHPSLTL